MKGVMDRPCECDRGPVVMIIRVTKATGELMDECGLCIECSKERVVTQALDALGLHP